MKNQVRIDFCEHTQTQIVQEKFEEEWVCIHDNTREEELENINNAIKELNYEKSIN